MRAWFGEGSGRRVRVGEGRGIGEGCGFVDDLVPVVEFVGEGKLLFHVREAREHDLAHVGEDSGFAKGDTVLRDGGKEFAEDVVDVGGGEEIAVEGGGNFGAKALGLEELEFLPGVKGTKGTMGRAAQHTAAAAVGEVELAAGGDTGIRFLVGHGSLLEVDLS